jgi:hypothetical protein
VELAYLIAGVTAVDATIVLDKLQALPGAIPTAGRMQKLHES